MFPSRVLFTTTCTFILFLLLSVDLAGTATPTPGSYSTNIINHATKSADKKCIDAVDPRFTMEYAFDKPSLSGTPCLMSALGALSESASQELTKYIEPTT